MVSPIAVFPALPAETLARITGSLGGGDAGVEVETREMAELPQPFADRFGWPGMVATVAGVYDGLPEDEKARACIFTNNYGEAVAVDFFGDEHGLPDAVSVHNSYHAWGPGDCTGEVVISVGVPENDLRRMFGSVGQSGTIRCGYCMPDEDNLPVYTSRDPRASMRELWPETRHFD